MSDEPPISSLPRPVFRRLLALRRLMDSARAPLELQILGRVLLHAALVGVAAGLMGSLFFAVVESIQRICLGGWTGYVSLRAGGETLLGEMEQPPPFRPWLLFVLPGLGALAG